MNLVMDLSPAFPSTWAEITKCLTLPWNRKKNNWKHRKMVRMVLFWFGFGFLIVFWHIWYLRHFRQAMAWLVMHRCWILCWIFSCDQVHLLQMFIDPHFTDLQTRSGDFNHLLWLAALHKPQTFTNGSCLNLTASVSITPCFHFKVFIWGKTSNIKLALSTLGSWLFTPEVHLNLCCAFTGFCQLQL